MTPPRTTFSSNAAALLPGTHVLVVDDDERIRALLGMALSEAGATTTLAAGGEDALVAFSRSRPDVLVSDLAMPGIDGHTLIRMVRSLAPDAGGQVPAIAISGRDDTAAAEALASGFDEFVRKPFAIPELVAAIRRRLPREVGIGRGAPPAPANGDRIRQLEDAVRVRDEFISTLAHELRNPLSPIFLQLHVLLDRLRGAPGGSVPAGEIQTGIEGVLRRCKRLLDTMNRVLDASALSSGRLTLLLEDVDLAEIARYVCEGREREMALARCELRFSAPEPVVGHWDKVRLEQVMENLLSNAMRYGAGGPIEVTIRGTATEGRLTVRDHGPGIAPQDVERIFGPFESALRKTNAGSFGIGLWVVRGICEALGGTIRVDSRPGEGASFVVALPRRREEAPA